MSSDILKDVLWQQPSGTLYHYTTQEGLLGIIKNKEIWATQTQYLNDAREYRHAIDVATSEIDKRLVNAASDESKILLDMKKGREVGLPLIKKIRRAQSQAS